MTAVTVHAGIGSTGHLTTALCIEACFATENPYATYGADLRGSLLATLKHWPHQRGEHHAAEVRERLSLLDAAQRAAAASLLHYLQTRGKREEATQILGEWPT